MTNSVACSKCGRDDVSIAMHHTDYENDITIPLCHSCHRIVHHELRKNGTPLSPPNFTWISEKQRSTMKLIGGLIKEFGEDHWFTQHELFGVTKHTMDALVEKGYLKCKPLVISFRFPAGIMYYLRLKTLEE